MKKNFGLVFFLLKNYEYYKLFVCYKFKLRKCVVSIGLIKVFVGLLYGVRVYL